MATLRNIRNMDSAGVSREKISRLISLRRDSDLVLPFRYIAAARINPSYEKYIDEAMIKSIELLPVFDDTTVVLVDVSGSMDHLMSARGDLTRLDAAAALATLIRGDIRVFTFSYKQVYGENVEKVRNAIRDIVWHKDNDLWEHSRAYYEGNGIEILNL